jgi:5-oxoprolinase (ATP-hydrolysing)
MAGSQPTMNNFTFGNARYQYYETISGGSGAGGVFDASGR